MQVCRRSLRTRSLVGGCCSAGRAATAHNIKSILRIYSTESSAVSSDGEFASATYMRNPHLIIELG